LPLATATLLLLSHPLASAADQNPALTLTTKTARFVIGENGALDSVIPLDGSRNYVASGRPAPLLSVRIANTFHNPNRATWHKDDNRLTLHFAQADIKAVIRAEAKPTHVVFELLEVQPAEKVELVVWGPYPTTIGDVIGEIVGVVRDREFAVGIQALNVKTLGGYPNQENDIEPDYTANDPGNYPNLPRELNKDQLFRGDTARHTDFGSVLQAFCRNRNEDRIIANWGHEKYLAPTFADGGVVGSKIALFACPAPQALETIGAIEVAEGLPHPMLDGVWIKTATNANCSYLIVDFSEQTIERAVEMTRRAGLTYLYHSSPFETWGHFKLKPSLFPNGWDGLRTCVEKARKAGVRIGLHTLSNFITPNDPYVTPKPDRRLARIGESTLTEEINADEKEIPVASPDFFRKQTDMNTVMIGEELIRYRSVSTEVPWRLLECERGAWGTRASAHASGHSVAKLMDHGYKVFLTDADLTKEVARNIARLCNHAGTLQISLDGLEGAWSTGMGQYGRALFTKSWFDELKPELRGQINDASNPGHFNWHIYTRMNWGEPWYAGFRESQTLYRFKNQLHFERNLMPHMLGWFALRADTSIEDAEWLLARAAGFDAGFALAASLASTAQLEADPRSAEAAKQFGAIPGILDAIKQWEAARMARAFPPEVKARLRDNTREFHLEPGSPQSWRLFEVFSDRFTYSAGATNSTEHRFTNPNAAQPLQWIVRSGSKQPVSGLALEINGKPVLDLQSQTLPPSGSAKYTGGPEAVLYDGAWKEVARVPVISTSAHINPGEHTATFRVRSNDSAEFKIELRTLSTPIEIRR
jgi:hypothetical protein